MRYKTLVAAAVLLAVMLGLGRGQAEQNSISATLSPNILEMRAVPGDVIERSIVITYENGPPLDAVVSKHNFRQRPDGAFDLLPVDEQAAETLAWAAAAWISVPQAPFRLTPNNAYLIPIGVAVPEQAEPGEYSAFVTIDFAGLGENTGVSLIPRLGARIYTTVEGEQRRQADDVMVFIEKKGLLGLLGPIEVTIRLHNSGTVHIDGSGTVELREQLTGTVREMQMPRRRILPDEDAYLSIPINGISSLIPTGKYSARLVPADAVLVAALPIDEIEFWTIDWIKLLAWLAVILGMRLFWAHGLFRSLSRRARKAAEAFWRG